MISASLGTRLGGRGARGTRRGGDRPGLGWPGAVGPCPGRPWSAWRSGLSSAGLAAVSREGCRDPGTGASPREAAAVAPGGPGSSAWVLAMEALLAQGGVHRAGALRNKVSFSVSLPVGRCHAGCGFRPGLGSVSLGDSESCCLGTVSRALAGKPSLQEVQRAPGEAAPSPSAPARTPGAPPPSPGASGSFLKRSREPCCLLGSAGAGVGVGGAC